MKGYVNTDYNRKRKNEIRLQVIEFFRKRINNNTTLHTLETRQFLFHKNMKGQKLRCYQISESEFQAMEKNKPKNVVIKNCDVNKGLFDFPRKLKGVYLDYCNTWRSNSIYIKKLFDTDKFDDKCPVALTFSIRKSKLHKKVTLKNDIFHTLQYYALTNNYVIHKYNYMGYRDTAPMATVTFEVLRMTR
jgi:hypothetical protein